MEHALDGAGEGVNAVDGQPRLAGLFPSAAQERNFQERGLVPAWQL